ncbi:MAG: hypothetical protein KZQ77_07265 [Candidatus Thiodiazotropha sp. (ex Notomyrtea botanica)]|nr:hypothetical protein [Candidatus Thiodiazotropha sp. (ex Notomyrtea botanica)]
MGRREALRFITLAWGIVGCMLVATVFVQYLGPAKHKVEERATRLNEVLLIDISEVKSGVIKKVIWQGVPIGIYKRTESQIGNYQKSIGAARYQSNDELELPAWWKEMSVAREQKWLVSSGRSIKDEFFVFNMVSPIFGCMVSHVPKGESEEFELNKHWPGGFYDPCQKAGFNYSGRVMNIGWRVPPLQVPPHRFVDDHTVELRPNG